MNIIKTASLAISLVLLGGGANAQSVIQYSDAQGYGYRTEPLYPYAPPQRSAPQTEPRSAGPKPVGKVDPALVEELRNKRKPKPVDVAVSPVKPPEVSKPKARADVTASVDKTPGSKRFTKTTVVREKPVVRTSYRVVEHPPIVVQREVGEDQGAESGNHAHAAPQPAPQGGGFAGRTIRAEAEITILGPDRMSIRLFRRQDGSDANAKVAKPTAKPTKPALRRSAGADRQTEIR